MAPRPSVGSAYGMFRDAIKAADVPAAAPATRLLESFLFGVGQLDGRTFLAPLVVAAAALPACRLPARRVSRIDPASALRAE